MVNNSSPKRGVGGGRDPQQVIKTSMQDRERFALKWRDAKTQEHEERPPHDPPLSPHPLYTT